MTVGLPRGWEQVALGEICRPRAGKVIPAPDDIRPYLSLDNIASDRGAVIGWEKSSDYGSQSVELHPEDVAYARLRPYLNKVAHVDCVALGSAELIVLPKSEAILPRYLQHLLLTPSFSEFAQHESTGDRPRLKWRQMQEYEFPLPPTGEQGRIVAAIEEHFSRLDAVEATQRRIIRQIDVLKSSLLSDAFRTNGDLPLCWEQQTIGAVAQVQLGRQRSPEHHAGPQMRPYLRSANVTWEGISLDDVKEMNFDDADFETYKLEPGDLLLNEASGSPGEVGKPAIWNGEIEDCCFQNTLLRLRSAEVDIRYLYWYCYASALSGRFGDAGRGVNIRHLGKGGLAQFPIPVAPGDQQAQIAAQLDQQLEQAKRLEQTAQEVLNRVAALRQAVLSQAFSGHLVPQDPNDEPASALLERIARSR